MNLDFEAMVRAAERWMLSYQETRRYIDRHYEQPVRHGIDHKLDSLCANNEKNMEGMFAVQDVTGISLKVLIACARVERKYDFNADDIDSPLCCKWDSDDYQKLVLNMEENSREPKVEKNKYGRWADNRKLIRQVWNS